MSRRQARLVRNSTADYRSHSMQELIAIADRKHEGMMQVIYQGRERIIVGSRYAAGGIVEPGRRPYWWFGR